MKVTMLGTAAIGYPLSFCNCENCQNARTHGGKSLRKRASILINDDLLIDIGPDTQTSMMMYQKDMSKIRYLLQTHIHNDHYDESLLATRIPYVTPKRLIPLELVANPKCLKAMSDSIIKSDSEDFLTAKGSKEMQIHNHPLRDGETITLGKYKIKGIHCIHDTINGSLLYIITCNNKSLFYATDTPALTKKALDELKEYKLDCIIMDHTFGNTNYSYSHLNENLFIEQINKLKKMGIIDNKTQIYGTHISHEGMPYHELAEKRAIKNGYHIAYDGEEIII